jgi:hypothetical protein
MNQRIRQLIKTKSTILFPGTDTVDCEITDIEKFAELIVRECAELATKEYNNRGAIHGNDLLDHFGVRE